MSRIRIIILAKEPLPGLAKTRLIPALGKKDAAQLADRLLQHTKTQALAANLGPVELCVTPDKNADYWQPWHKTPRLELTQQTEGNLGMRLAEAAKKGLSYGCPVMLIGTDCPLLDAAYLQTMAEQLTHYDACICPVNDGGYSLLGLKQFNPSLFNSIPWSTNKVAALTTERLRQLNWQYYESKPLWDIDEPQDLPLLKNFPELLQA